MTRDASVKDFGSLIPGHDAYRATYEIRVNPLVDKSLWEHVYLPYTVLPPESRRPRGRPKKKRIRDPNELKKTKRMHKCGRCGNWGHHKSSCKEPLKCVEAQGSQAVARPPRKLVPRRRTKNKKKSSTDGQSDVVAVSESQAHISSHVSANISESCSMRFAFNSGSQ
ncbi:hypothetical protein QJS10_CPA16g00712 [Acorus calamus]|uniref:CCHC-type domain-containing protein n=1 Tax=Acorus calamus TaxID=4465 RepID=A0AAV9D212_ACOCL|nr:hypothetical protein QJS10_CPA16g00712 [Acorus calamus]